VRREQLAAVWVGASKIPTSGKIGQKWGTRAVNGTDVEKKKARRRKGMDITWLTDRIAVGGGIWNADNMATVAKAGITHVLDMQIEFDDTALGAEHGIEVLWNATDDDFEPKPAELFQRGVEFAQDALEADGKIYIHCAAGVHRAPMMAAAVLATTGWTLDDAMRLIVARRPVADFPDVYVASVEEFLDTRERTFTTGDTEGQ
jgi:protein-tyrosine phosphatase